jgi:hypothetical protein
MGEAKSDGSIIRRRRGLGVLTGRRPVFYVPGAVHNRVALSVPRGWTQGIPLLHAMESVGGCHVAARLQVADLHAADETPPRAHAETHRGWTRKQRRNIDEMTRSLHMDATGAASLLFILRSVRMSCHRGYLKRDADVTSLSPRVEWEVGRVCVRRWGGGRGRGG